VLAGRYRVVALLGRGGMGEVYRADDLKLGQAVALKFLPAGLARDPGRLARFHQEVRLARQVSHPHVCRVWDVGEADGRPFLTMEYVDGQDLAALLRQAGRLPEDRGVELARQLCRALGAVHEQGLLHRDLKPQNVLLDGRGNVRLSDFGLAAVAGAAEDVRSGTPAYQAPEQLAGKEVSARSDLFALGLVLYEVFTGRRAFPAGTREELGRLHAQGPPPTPSSQVGGLNPAVERAILRCLERDPGGRPRSAYEVLAALPGGDPLAAALAAGETPSPGLVADAPVEGGLPPAVGLALLAALLLGMVAVAFLNDRVQLFRKVPLDLRPEVLTHQARAAAERLGYGGRPADSASGFLYDAGVLEYLRERDASPGRWDALATGQPAALYFWYRQSPAPLAGRVGSPGVFFTQVPGQVTPAAPPPDLPGMVSVFLDPKGRLIELQAVPPAAVPRGAGRPVDWRPAFEAAGLDEAAFRPAAPRRRPPVYADATRAWLGAYPDRPGMPLRVEAAACYGRVVFFRAEPGDGEEPSGAAGRGPLETPPAVELLFAAILVVALTVGSWLAWRNWRLGRANARGAGRLALFCFAAAVLHWLAVAHHPWSFTEEVFASFAPLLGLALVEAALLWLTYVALEPSARRRWPWRIVAWNRVLEGRFRDPLVGRDLLLGGLAGVGVLLLELTRPLAPTWFGRPPEVLLAWLPLAFTRAASVGTFALVEVALALPLFFTLWVLVALLRREWLAAAVFVLVWVALDVVGSEHPALDLPFFLLVEAIPVVVLLRWGLLAYASSIFFFTVLWNAAPTADLSAWYAGTGLLYAVLLGGLAACGLVLALAGRPVLPRGWPGEG
jgi:serine/threonine-protein kinase